MKCLEKRASVGFNVKMLACGVSQDPEPAAGEQGLRLAGKGGCLGAKTSTRACTDLLVLSARVLAGLPHGRRERG